MNPPPPTVLAAFGAASTPVPLDGGQGTAWVAGDVVLKPLDLSLEELAWQAELFASITFEGVRVPRPRWANGSLVVDGWCAWDRVEGEHRRSWGDVIAAGELFHQALREVPRPDFVARRTHPWAIGDRVAWEELAAEDYSFVKHVPGLVSARRALALPSQLVHGDLGGNVLFADGLPPAVIDFSPYWRPLGFASAIVVADALVWEGADESILAAVAHVDEFPQLLLRALIYRAVTDRLFRLDQPIRADDADPYLPAVELACGLAG